MQEGLLTLRPIGVATLACLQRTRGQELNAPKINWLELNLTSMGISGSVPSSLANLTAVTQIWLGGNKLTGSIPNLSTLKGLQTLHLGNNKLEGTIPQSLGQLEQLRELFLQNNNLDGRIPDSLRNKKGLHIQVSPGNHQSS
uniref:Leucine-rich repeat-containing N-terminal plant-type domain-containing protein n=2 Tax=Salix viminalis TaxID=40686 RepID=A0A6N2L3F4_SALVM